MFNYHRHRATKPRDSLSREIGERSVSATLEQLGDAVRDMPPAEQRGYVKAYAMPIVFEEALQLVGHDWPPKARRDLALAALEQAVHLVVEQLKLPPVVAMPTPHVRIYRAA